jgi:hypothetical protein
MLPYQIEKTGTTIYGITTLSITLKNVTLSITLKKCDTQYNTTIECC